MEQRNPELTLHYSPSKFVGGVVIVAFTLFLLEIEAYLAGMIVGSIVDIIVMSVLLILAGIKLKDVFSSAPRIRIDPNGITIFEKKWGLLRWKDIDSLWLTHISKYGILCIKLKGPDKWFQKMSSVERKFRGFDRSSSYGHVQIKTVTLNCTVYDILDHINYLMKQFDIPVSVNKHMNS